LFLALLALMAGMIAPASHAGARVGQGNPAKIEALSAQRLSPRQEVERRINPVQTVPTAVDAAGQAVRPHHRVSQVAVAPVVRTRIDRAHE